MTGLCLYTKKHLPSCGEPDTVQTWIPKVVIWVIFNEAFAWMTFRFRTHYNRQHRGMTTTMATLRAKTCSPLCKYLSSASESFMHCTCKQGTRCVHKNTPLAKKKSSLKKEILKIHCIHFSWGTVSVLWVLNGSCWRFGMWRFGKKRLQLCNI